VAFGDPPHPIELQALDPNLRAAHLLAEAMAGIAEVGEVGLGQPPSASAVLVHAVESPPLREILRDCMQVRDYRFCPGSPPVYLTGCPSYISHLNVLTLCFAAVLLCLGVTVAALLCSLSRQITSWLRIFCSFWRHTLMILLLLPQPQQLLPRPGTLSPQSQRGDRTAKPRQHRHRWWVTWRKA
jgi:hypothetical protein